MRRADREALREIRAVMESTGEPLDMTDRELRAAVIEVAGGHPDALAITAWMLRYPPGARPPYRTRKCGERGRRVWTHDAPSA